VIPHISNGGAACFCALPRLPGCWKVFTNPQITTTTWEDSHDVGRIVERIEQATKRRMIEDSAKDSRTIMRDESKDDSDDGKP
jgi:hypothetical protein